MASTTIVLEEVFPRWEWETPDGGTGPSADTGSDAVELTQHAQQAGLNSPPDPPFSAFNSFRSHIRLPLWHAEGELRSARQQII
jgi:hypothetical protein